MRSRVSYLLLRRASLVSNSECAKDQWSLLVWGRCLPELNLKECTADRSVRLTPPALPESPEKAETICCRRRRKESRLRFVRRVVSSPDRPGHNPAHRRAQWRHRHRCPQVSSRAGGDHALTNWPGAERLTSSGCFSGGGRVIA